MRHEFEERAAAAAAAVAAVCGELDCIWALETAKYLAHRGLARLDSRDGCLHGSEESEDLRWLWPLICSVGSGRRIAFDR